MKAIYVTDVNKAQLNQDIYLLNLLKAVNRR